MGKRSLLGRGMGRIALGNAVIIRDRCALPHGKGLNLAHVLFPSISGPTFYRGCVLQGVNRSTVSIRVPSSHSIIRASTTGKISNDCGLISAVGKRITHRLRPNRRLAFDTAFTKCGGSRHRLSLSVSQRLRTQRSLVTKF